MYINGQKWVFPFIYIFQRAVTHSKKCSIDQIFFLQVQNIPINFFCSLRSIQMSIFFGVIPEKLISGIPSRSVRIFLIALPIFCMRLELKSRFSLHTRLCKINLALKTSFWPRIQPSLLPKAETERTLATLLSTVNKNEVVCVWWSQRSELKSLLI